MIGFIKIYFKLLLTKCLKLLNILVTTIMQHKNEGCFKNYLNNLASAFLNNRKIRNKGGLMPKEGISGLFSKISITGNKC